VLQCAAVCCSVLQCVAVCCSVLQCVALCCSVLHCVVVCCGVLQCAAVCCSAPFSVAKRVIDILTLCGQRMTRTIYIRISIWLPQQRRETKELARLEAIETSKLLEEKMERHRQESLANSLKVVDGEKVCGFVHTLHYIRKTVPMSESVRTHRENTRVSQQHGGQRHCGILLTQPEVSPLSSHNTTTWMKSVAVK